MSTEGRHAFRWNTDCSGRGKCKLCGLRTAHKPAGPKGGCIQVYRVGGLWQKTAPACPEAKEGT